MMDDEKRLYNLLLSHTIRAAKVRTEIDAGLKSVDVFEGVKLEHQEYLDLINASAEMFRKLNSNDHI